VATYHEHANVGLMKTSRESPDEVVRQPGWRTVFGQALPEEVAPIDEIVAEELERVDPEEWAVTLGSRLTQNPSSR
jgi:hypothetical protein